MRKIIRLTESDLHRIIRSTAKRVLREMDGDVEENGGDIVSEARAALVRALQNGVVVNVINPSFFDGDITADLDIETDDGWWFSCEGGLELYFEIDEHSYYSPATRIDPEEWGDAEGHVESVDLSTEYPIQAFPPSQNEGENDDSIDLPIDDELRNLIVQHIDVDKIEIDNDIVSEFETYHAPDNEYDDDPRDRLRDEWEFRDQMGDR